MTRVDFYVLKAQASGDRFQLACRIAERARRAGHRVLLHVPDTEQQRHLDGLLWTLWDQGFVPHGLLGRDDPALNPILIGDGNGDLDEHEVLVNLAAEVPPFFSRFTRLVECVDHEASVRSAGRDRFRYYRAHGYPLQTHEVA